MSSGVINISPMGNRQISKVVTSWWFWPLFCTFFFAYPIFRSLNRKLPPELPVLYSLPEFSFVDENGAVFGSKELQGKAYIANFHFTSCPTMCPPLMKDLQQIQSRVAGLGQNVAIVSFTVDPRVDQPKKLYEHARKLQANPYVWKFLTADNGESLTKFIVNGFKMAVGSPEQYGREISEYDIAHSGKLVLVDGKGNVRGLYSTQKADVDRLMIDLGLLVNRGKMTSWSNKS